MADVPWIAQSDVNVRELARNESPTISTVSTDAEFSIIPNSSASLRGSILKKPYSARPVSVRIDCSGNVIVPGSRSHRVSFADELSDSPRPIAKVHHVESWKSWNFGNRFADGASSCVCRIS